MFFQRLLQFGFFLLQAQGPTGGLIVLFLVVPPHLLLAADIGQHHRRLAPGQGAYRKSDMVLLAIRARQRYDQAADGGAFGLSRSDGLEELFALLQAVGEKFAEDAPGSLVRGYPQNAAGRGIHLSHFTLRPQAQNSLGQTVHQLLVIELGFSHGSATPLFRPVHRPHTLFSADLRWVLKSMRQVFRVVPRVWSRLTKLLR